MLKNFKFRTRFIASNTIVLILMLIIAFFVQQKVTLLIATSQMVTFTHVAIDYGNKIIEALVNMETGERGFVITGKESFLEPYHEGKKQLLETIATAKKHVSHNTSQVALLEKIKAEAERWEQEVAEVVIQKKAENPESRDANDLISSEMGKKQMSELRKLIDEFMATEAQLLTARSVEAENAAHTVIYVTLVGTITAIFFSILIIILINQSILEVVKRVVSSSFIVDQAAEEFAQANSNLSQRTEEQAASLQQTSASVEQLTTTVQQNVDSVKQAARLSDSAREQALNGGNAVDAVVKAMMAINLSSNKVADIIGVIDEIAFQTNLLALNAAVEAARAGEQGRGFAVVATEVRHLAQRSTAAAKEIRILIKDSADKVGEGTQLANHAGTTLVEIITTVKKVSDIMNEIAAASTEQAAGIEQINKAIVQLDSITQHNASLVEEAMAASESLKGQAEQLKEDMSFFAAAPAVVKSLPAVKKPGKLAKSEPGKKPTSQNAEEWQDF